MSTKIMSPVLCILVWIISTVSLVQSIPMASSQISSPSSSAGSRSSEYSSGTSLVDDNQSPNVGFGNILPDYRPSKTNNANNNENSNNNNNAYYPSLVNSLQRPSYRWAMLPTEDLLSAFQNDRLVFLRMPLRARNPLSRKRSCLINAGMTNNCDFKDFISATSARRMWESPSGPGKRSILSPSSSSSSLSASSSNFDQTGYHRNAPLLSSSMWIPADRTDNSRPSMADYDQSSKSSTESGSRSANKRMECLSGLPGGDCENTFLGSESMGQDFLRPGGRNPGRR